MTGSMEKREAPRVAPYLASCRVIDGERKTPGYMSDLSIKGARVACEGPAPAEGAAVVIEVRLTGRRAHSRLGARVRWSRGPQGDEKLSSFGFVFSDLSEEEAAEVHEAIEEFKRRAAALS
jgi:hypothetical protein